MSSSDTVESYLRRIGIAHDQVEASTWMITLEDARTSRILARIEDPIILFSTPVFTVGVDTHDRVGLFQRLLELNSELMHSAYALQDGRVVLSGAQELENLDLNEFQAVIDDMTMALDRHLPQLQAWDSTANAAQSGASEPTS